MLAVGKSVFCFFTYIYIYISLVEQNKKIHHSAKLAVLAEFQHVLNPKIKTSFREIWVIYKSLMTHCFQKVNKWVTYTVICFKNSNLDTKSSYIYLFP